MNLKKNLLCIIDDHSLTLSKIVSFNVDKPTINDKMDDHNTYFNFVLFQNKT